jgi:hypothetical protein
MAGFCVGVGWWTDLGICVCTQKMEMMRIFAPVALHAADRGAETFLRPVRHGINDAVPDYVAARLNARAARRAALQEG